ncbi:hypothetical protein IR016_04930 [Pseudomonas putida]|uniref:hypothetical protein n=1 Tax=Pseudomonas putida TaxID=303 RepID=UPI0018A917F4|nr:hypothetical protein [Pseudomonas putida]MBF8706132.1 hypothetical protein [Pseudomonas putida]
MVAIYGARTKDASGVVTLDTSVTPMRSIYNLQVTGNGAWDQYFSIPQIKANSFVVVQSPTPNTAGGIEAWWSPGTLHLRRAYSGKWNVKILSYGDTQDGETKYGIRTRNGDNLVQVDNSNKVMRVADSGAFAIGRRGPGDYITSGGGTFKTPVTTIEEPYVFLRSDTGMMVCNYRVRGSPGAWTGFTVDGWFGGAFNTAYYTVKWMVGTTVATNTALGDYGIEINNELSEATFNSNDNFILLSGAAPSSDRFKVAGSDVVTGSTLWSSFQMPWTGDFDDYFLASSLLPQFYDGYTIYENPAGFHVGNRNVLQAYSGANAGTNASGVNGRTVFAGRPMRAL